MRPLLRHALTRRPSLPTAIALLALAVATTGTAAAATGQLVNISDPTTAANVARVDAAGALKTTTSGTVSARPTPPASTFDTFGSITNFYKNGSQYLVITPATSATVAITRLLYTNGITNTNDWEVFVYYETIPSGGTCKAFSAGHKFIAHVNVKAHDSLVDALPSPVVLKPKTGSPQWCLVAGGGPTQASASTTDGALFDISVTGFVVSGAFAPATARATDQSKQPQPDRLGG